MSTVKLVTPAEVFHESTCSYSWQCSV